MGIFSVSGSTVNEGTVFNDPNFLQWTISRSGDTSTTETVSYRLISGTAQAQSDIYGRDSSMTFAAGETSKTISYRVDADSIAEDDEAAILEVFNPTGGGVLAGNVSILRSTGWILDDDTVGPTPSIFVSRPILTEGDSGTRQAVFDVSLSRASSDPLVLDYTTVDGSALAGEDYTATSGTLSLVAGQRNATIVVDVTGDTTLEDTEHFTIDLD
ncbi:MAG: Calx-beta domain-containing protein, partial [Acidobacteriota bacterium]